MDVTETYPTHSVACDNKSPLHFNRFIFDRMKERDNTHYCFHCGGDWGFTPDKNGVATNCENGIISICHQDGSEVTMSEALEDINLEPHLSDSPDYPRRRPTDKDYAKWIGYTAPFDYSLEFAKWCEQNGYAINRWNAMWKHDPVAHADAIVGGAEKYTYAEDWLKGEKLPEKFPYIIWWR